MAVLQNEVEKWIEDLPRQLTWDLVSDKLRSQNVALPKKKLAHLVDHILAGDESAEVDLGRRHRNLRIEFTDADMAELDKRADELLVRLPAIIEKRTEGFSLDVLSSLKKKWPREWRQQQREMEGFRTRLEGRWEDGLHGLRLLITMALEFGDDFNKDGHAAGGGSNPVAFDVRNRLHARSCQVADEVLCLMANGFADGAMARWRTMQEIAAVVYLIGEHGDALAERYIAHQIVEARSAAIQYRKHQDKLGQEPISDEEFEAIERDYQAALLVFGNAFAGPYGWAAEHVGKNKPSMADIQEAASIGHLGPYYKMASHNVHANPKGVFFKLGLIGEREVLLAGASNAGLVDPGHATARSLVQIASVLMNLNPTIDNLVVVKIMNRLADEIGVALSAAHEKLVEDERSFQKKGTR